MRQCTVYLLLCAAFALTLVLRSCLEQLSVPSLPPADPQRIISLAPSVTETLYAVGLGARVVGATEFCDYPPELSQVPRVAGFSEINFEAMVRLQPDLVVLPKDKMFARQQIERIGLPVVPLDTRSLPGFMHDAVALGRVTGKADQAETLIAALNMRIESARFKAEGQRSPSVLVVVMHAYQTLGSLTEVNAVGRDGFYDELISIAGGKNVYQGGLSFPRLSRESLIYLDPEVIIDILPPHANLADVRRDWESLPTLSAIRNNRLYLFNTAADSVPGPRSGETLTRFSQALYPETGQKLP